MGILAWLGLQNGDAYPNVEALTRELRKAMPESESCVLRYIAVVVVLLGRVALADGRFSALEEEQLRGLLEHIEGLSPTGVDAVCRAVQGKTTKLTEEELTLCYRELKALCDGKERVEVLRLLRDLAAVDGRPSRAEREEIERIATEIGVPLAALRQEVGLRDESTSS